MMLHYFDTALQSVAIGMSEELDDLYSSATTVRVIK
jgi:hypothetical protein